MPLGGEAVLRQDFEHRVTGEKTGATGRQRADDRLYRRWQDRPSDLRSPDLERLQSRRLPALLARRFREARRRAGEIARRCRRKRRYRLDMPAERRGFGTGRQRSGWSLEIRTRRPGRGRIRLASGLGQAAICGAARRQRRDLSRRRSKRHTRHGDRAQSRDLSRRAGRRGEESRAGRSRPSPICACISAISAPPPRSSGSTISWSPCISPAPRRRWRWA